MAEKRMFAKTIIDSDAFLDMPLSTQALYFHLSMRADDDGFVNNPKKIQRMIGGSDDDLKLLLAKSFIILFDNGIIVIKHWRLHNTIQKDRYKPTVYKEEMAMLQIKENKSYTLGIPGGNQPVTECIQDVSNMDTQIRLDKDRLDKLSIDIDAGEPPAPKKEKSIRHKYGQYENVLLSDADMEKLKAEFPYDWQQRIERLSEYVASSGKSYKNHLATIRSWARKDKQQPQQRKQYNDKPVPAPEPVPEVTPEQAEAARRELDARLAALRANRGVKA